MPINPETLTKHRNGKGWSQEDLAKQTREIRGGAVSKRQISRIETGQTHPDKVRRHTVESLARALGTTVETLSKPLQAEDDARLREIGFRSVKVSLSPETLLNFRLVMHHYGVGMYEIINAAPWMFTLLAESSLAERRQRLGEAASSFEDAMKRLPAHLGHAAGAGARFNDAGYHERDSIAARDIFGKKVLQEAASDGYSEPFNPDETNPFFDFLGRMAQAAGSEAIDIGDHYYALNEGLPYSWPVFHVWLRKLTSGDFWAFSAIKYGHARLDEIPEELMADERGAERAAWLASKLPPGERARLEQTPEARLLLLL